MIIIYQPSSHYTCGFIQILLGSFPCSHYCAVEWPKIACIILYPKKNIWLPRTQSSWKLVLYGPYVICTFRLHHLALAAFEVQILKSQPLSKHLLELNLLKFLLCTCTLRIKIELDAVSFENYKRFLGSDFPNQRILHCSYLLYTSRHPPMLVVPSIFRVGHFLTHTFVKKNT